MNDRERAIVMAYTGIAMLVGDKLPVFDEYIAEKIRNSRYTPEYVKQTMSFKELAKEDFIALCAGDT